MIRSLLTLSAALLASASVAATAPPTSPSSMAARTDAVARQYRLAGEMLVARGGRILFDRGYGTILPTGGAPHRAGERWRLASITKQVTAALVMRDAAGTLDTPVSPVLERRPGGTGPGSGYPPLGDVTVRQLLTHHSGLANPNDTPAGRDGVPSFYRAGGGDLGYCRSKTSVPGAPFSYNNCDYLLLESYLKQTGRPLRWPAGMAMARPGERGVPGFIGGQPEGSIELRNYGASGGLIGTVRSVFDFDHALMTGAMLPPSARDILWKPEGSGSAQALGQWVFAGQLKGCAAPKRIVQRDGEIYGMQARNYILPDDGLVVIVFTNRSSDDFALGEVWEGKGFVYDLLSAAACG